MPVPFETAIDKIPELLGKILMIKKMMDTQAGSRGFGRVRWADAFLRRPDTEKSVRDGVERGRLERSLAWIRLTLPLLDRPRSGESRRPNELDRKGKVAPCSRDLLHTINQC